MLIRYGAVAEINTVFKNKEDLNGFLKEQERYAAKQSGSLRVSASPFVSGDKFEYDLENFLYYRARAITANVVNINGDHFQHPELKKSYRTFIGKGVYFNHNSNDPELSFGILLDAAYTPDYYGNDTYEDKYVELLGAIHRKACEEKYPGLLKDIETGRVSSTSMGVIAKRATCSICGNMATDTSTLCAHVRPGSPLYCKGMNIYGKTCYEDNFDLSFIEDSVVYIPADPTAKILEIYASAKRQGIAPLVDHLMKYASAAGHTVSRESISLCAGGLVDNLTKKAAEMIPGQQAPEEPEQESKKVKEFQAELSELPKAIEDQGFKYLSDAATRVIQEEIRKNLSPLKKVVEDSVRSRIQEFIAPEVAKAEKQVENVLPEAVGKTEHITPGGEKVSSGEAASAPAASEKIAELPPLPEAESGKEKSTKAEAKSAKSSVIIVEDFSKWPAMDRAELIGALERGASWTFKGEVE